LAYCPHHLALAASPRPLPSDTRIEFGLSPKSSPAETFLCSRLRTFRKQASSPPSGLNLPALCSEDFLQCVCAESGPPCLNGQVLS
ncbi:hypothetical protein NDU88_003496, partial [Pleurodeles waltl]